MSPATVRSWAGTGLVAVALATFVMAPPRSWGQHAERKKERKAVSTVKPVYPELAREMHVSGTVKLEIVIAPSGVVKSVKALGGHPLLLMSAMDAVKHWKYEPGPQETTTVVEFLFANDM